MIEFFNFIVFSNAVSCYLSLQGASQPEKYSEGICSMFLETMRLTLKECAAHHE